MPLYPAIAPFDTGYLPVGDGHRLYYEQSGDPDGVPLVFLHGGPGSGCSDFHHRFTDPARYRAVLFDQRGCGKSTPAGELVHNHTAALVADIERLREHLGIEKWVVHGGSWGATLALEYAKKHRERVIAMLLRGSFLARREDLDWFAGPDGIARELPEAHARLCAALDLPAGSDPLPALYRRVLDEQVEVDATLAAWNDWECAVMNLPASGTANRQAKTIHLHYCRAGFFLAENGVLDGLESLAGLPVTLVHGEVDQVCRISGAELLHARLPESELIRVADTGHSLGEAVLQDAIVRALQSMSELM
jgi:proline iminopeptidase